jgi:hypothetical protein
MEDEGSPSQAELQAASPTRLQQLSIEEARLFREAEEKDKQLPCE